MKVKIEKIKNSEIQIICEIPKQTFSKYYEKTLLSLTKKSDIPGFRKGNTPKNIIEKNISIEAILYKTANLVITESYSKIISENKLELIGQPKIEIIKIAKNNDFKFKIQAFLTPEIELPDYKKIALKIKSEKESLNQIKIKQEVEEAILFLQKSKASRIAKNNPAELNDWVEISFSSPNINNNKIEKQQFILGQGHFIPGFEEQIKGIKTGETKSFSIKFPQNHPEQTLTNKKISFNLKLEGVYSLKLPILNDNFAKDLGEFTNLEDLKTDIKNKIIQEKKQVIRQNKKDKLLKNIIKDAIINIPKEILEQEKNNLLNESKEKIKNHFKINLSKYLEQIKKTEQEFEALHYQKAEANLKIFFTLYEIAKKEKIILTNKEIKDKIEEVKKQINFFNEQNALLNNKKIQQDSIENLRSQAKTILIQEKIFNLLL